MTRIERLILSNQFKILEKLDPGSEKHYSDHREAVERGYELHYGDLFAYIPEEGLTREQCSEVLDVMTMYSVLNQDFKDLKDKTGIDPKDLRFGGFDGNNESELLSYANYFCKQDGGRFIDIVNEHVPNSHMPSIEMYRRMLRAFAEVPERQEKVDRKPLCKASIQKVLDARAWKRED